MQLVELTERDKKDYNNFVATNDGGSFLQSWEWGSWQEALGRKIFRYWILDDIENRIASVQFIKMPLLLGKHYLYCPYGPVTDLRFKIEDLRFILQGIQEKFADAVFIRIEPKLNVDLGMQNAKLKKTQNIQPGKTLIIDLSKSEEQLLAEMHHKTRYNIKLSEKHGVQIKDEFHLVNGKGILAKEVVELIAKTSGRQGFKTQGVGYFEKLIDFFALQNNNADLKLHIYKALYQNELLASAIIVDFPAKNSGVRTYLFGGSSEKNKNLMAPYLLHFRAMQDAKADGLSKYDFWGIETSAGDTPGFVRFKLGFSESEDAIKQYAGAYDIVTGGALYFVYKVFRRLNRLFK